MAILMNQNADDKDTQSQGSLSNTALNQSNSAYTTGTSATPASGAKAPGTPASSGRFTNLQKYVRANTGSNFAQDVGNKIAQKTQQAQSDISKAQDVFNTGAQQGRVATESNKGVLAAGAGDISNLQEEQQRQFGNIMQSGGYQGPQGLQDQQKLLGQAQQVQQIGKLATSTPGRTALLSDFYGRPQYAQGARNLDTALLSQDKSGALQQASAKTAALQGMANQAINLAGMQAADYAGQDKALIQQAQQAFNAQAGSLASAAENQAKAANEARSAKQQSWKDQMTTGNITDPELAAKLGLDKANYDSMLGGQVKTVAGLDPSSVFSWGGPVSQGQALTDQQKLKLAALTSLAGKYGSSELDRLKGIDLSGQAAPEYSVNNEALEKGVDAYSKGVQSYNQAKEEASGVLSGLSPDQVNDAAGLLSKRSAGQDISGFNEYGTVERYGGGINPDGTLRKELVPVLLKDANALADKYQAYLAKEAVAEQNLKNFMPQTKKLVYRPKVK